MSRLTVLGLVLAIVASCAAPTPRDVGSGNGAHIVPTAKPLQCVPYARSVSDISIRGDAWTWWQASAGQYSRSSVPAVGSILVLKRTKNLTRGHVAVVKRLLGRREILVDHANWLNKGQIHKNALVRDVSSRNDWSAVRVWYTPGNTLGKSTYVAYGFIHSTPDSTLKMSEPLMNGPKVRDLQRVLAGQGFDVSVDGYFGADTLNAVRAYQARQGLAADGIAGPATLARLGL